MVKETPVWEHWWQCKDGSLVYLEDRSVPTYNGTQLVRIDGVLRDITIRKQVEEALKQREEHFRTVIENASVGACIVGLNGKFLTVNRALKEMLGYSEEELRQKTFNEITHGEDREKSASFVSHLLDGKMDSFSLEKRYLHKEGYSIWGLVSSSLIKNSNGEPQYFVTHIQNITDRKKAEIEIIKAKEHAEEMNRLKSNFLASMSHELRTPLVGLLGFSELLQGEVHGNSREYANMINISGLRLLKTLNDILHYSEIEAEKKAVTVSDILINELIKSEIKLFLPMAQKKGLIITENLCEDFTAVTDEGYVREILDNLINNAVKFTHEGGITVRLSTNESNFIIEVIDTGIGIPEDKLEFIFEEFRQVSEGLGRNFDGTGLGLAIVKKYVTYLSGSIKVDSELGKGSIFTVTLPIQHQTKFKNTPEEGLKKSKEEVEVIPPQKLKGNDVLLVEDDAINALAIIKMIEDKFNVVHVTNAKDAISQAKARKFDLILMDINLRQGMSGIDAALEIRKVDQHKDVPITAITAYAMEKDKEEFFEKGFSHYLAKPFTQYDFLKLIYRILKQD
jgi:PAS domain S-box-containing protein